MRSPAAGPRVVPLDAGILVHTGLPNPGLNKVLKRYRNLWLMLPLLAVLLSCLQVLSWRAGRRHASGLVRVAVGTRSGSARGASA
ncbi:hypothetical protein HC928_25570, partial [bacterium]|nr:hypothetical protein [bacterium]